MDEQLAIILCRGGNHAAKRAAWERVIRVWKDSGLGVTEFAQRYGICLKRLFQWRRKLQPLPGGEPAGFVEVMPPPTDHGPPEQRIEIQLGAARVLAPPGTSLREVFLALKEAVC